MKDTNKPDFSVKDGNCKVSTFINKSSNGNIYYDIVILRKIKDKESGELIYKKGANIKPSDLRSLIELLLQTESLIFKHIRERTDNAILNRDNLSKL